MKAGQDKVGRLAPTPSGSLHLGNALAFAAAWLSIRSVEGTLLLRVEDIDIGRCKASVADQQRRDLEWLGLTWDLETPPQSTREYRPYLDALSTFTFRCQCTRRMLKALGRPHKGECNLLPSADQPQAIRMSLPSQNESFFDRASGQHTIDLREIADPILWRKDGEPSYTLAVVVDDIRDGVTEVVRGADLLEQAAVQQIIWKRFAVTPPTWLHSPIILGEGNTKLSKSHQSTGIHQIRSAGGTREEIWRMLLPYLGIGDCDNLNDALLTFNPNIIDQTDVQI